MSVHLVAVPTLKRRTRVSVLFPWSLLLCFAFFTEHYTAIARRNIDNGFLVAICGSDAEQNAENLPAIHLAQRLGHIDDRIAFWHENGLTGGVLFQQQKYRTIESLQNFKAAVADGTIEIPAEWCHSEMLDRWVEENGFDPKMHNPFNNTTAEETQALLTEAYS